MLTNTLTGVLEQHPFVEGFWPEHVARLAAMAGDARFLPGELIFQEGDHSSLFYLLISGTAALETVSAGRPVHVATLYAGDVLGWSSLTGDDSKQFQVRALEEVYAVAFDGARLSHACEEDYAFGFRLMRAVLRVMAGRVHAVRQQLVGAYTPVGAH
jgi:CRP-like cAMP-binding protein